MTSTERTSADTGFAAVGILARTGGGTVSAGLNAEEFATDT
ncbi:hypothetical protein [Streptosporangium sp. LJ11]